MAIKRFNLPIVSEGDDKEFAPIQNERRELQDPASTRVPMIEDNAEFAARAKAFSTYATLQCSSPKVLLREGERRAHVD